MQKINLEDYNNKRKSKKIELLKLRDSLPKKRNGNIKARDKDKQELLFRLAKKKKGKMMKQVGDRKYQLLK